MIHLAGRQWRFPIAVATVALVLMGGAGPVLADAKDQDACIASFDASQDLRVEGKLQRAREELIACSNPRCHDAITVKCTEWLDEVEAALPSLVVVVEGIGGKPTSVQIDGADFGAVDGRAIVLDPGPHEVVVVSGGHAIRRNIVLSEGQKRQRVVFARPIPEPTQTSRLPPPPAPVVPPRSNVVATVLGWGGLGVFGAGAVLGAVTGVVAFDREEAITERCGGACPESERDAYDAALLFADVSTAAFVVSGVGAASALAGLALWLHDETRELSFRITPTGVVVAGAF